LKRMQLYLQFERLLSDSDLEKIRPLVKRRAQREPLQHILGTVEWGGLTLKCDRRALVPRPETETLLELILARVRPNAHGEPSLRVLDLGTGTGALAFALARAWPEAQLTAVDRSEDALALARENGEALGLLADGRVSLLHSDWFAALPPEARFDVIVSNPPYLTAAEVAAAEPEVRLFDPGAALIAADDGCADLKKIIAHAAVRLAPEGLLALEAGIDQHSQLLAAIAAAGLTAGESKRDLSGRERFLFARK
ncbi:MAG: peptide chain release factor N(5)-glutamine methyltransferase, partial [Verrucomicrobia bacterium]